MPTERITVSGKEIVLVGTAHVSAESVEAVKKAIEQEKPDSVGIELCRQRYEQLKSGERWRETNVLDIVKRGQTYLFLLNLLLANFQARIGQEIGVKPGQEMLSASEAAESKGLKIEFLDRDVRTTLKRAIARMGIIEKLRFGYSILAGFFGAGEELTSEKIEELKRKDVMSQLMEELSRELPIIKKVLVDERDSYIAQKILASNAKKIVAVVGAGHLEGIKKHLAAGVQTASISELEKIPKKRNYLAVVKYALPVAFIAIVAYALLAKGIEASAWVLFCWFLITGLLAAVGVVFARGSLLAVLTAFVAAPFTTLHPLLAVGWFAGLAQAKSTMPKVKDFEELHALNSYSDFARNPVTKILLVTAFANIGGTIGTVIALPYVISIIA